MRYLMRVPFIFGIFFIIFCMDKAYCQEIEFNFDPPDGLTFYQIQKSTKVTDMGELGKRTDVTESKTKIEIKKTSTGYFLTATPVSIKMLHNGQEMNNPVLSLLQEIIVIYEIDSNGKIVSILGYDKLTELMQESFSPQVIQQLSSILNEEAMVNKEIAEWNGRIGNFAGLKVDIGDVFTAIEEFPIPTGGSITYYTATKIIEKTNCGNGECVRIGFSYNSDTEAFKEFVGDAVENLTETLEVSEEKPEISGMGVVGEGERVINPSNMLIYSEITKRTITMQLDIPEQGKIPTTQYEEREYVFEY